MQKAKQETIVAWLLVAIGFTITGFYLVGPRPFGLPAWLGAAIAISLLFGVFFAYRAMGALRARFIALFAAALIAAPIFGWLVTRHT